MDQLGFLFVANLCVWGGIFFYIVTLKRRQAAMEKDLLLLKEESGKDGD
jgi:CcmD family protein